MQCYTYLYPILFLTNKHMEKMHMQITIYKPLKQLLILVLPFHIDSYTLLIWLEPPLAVLQVKQFSVVIHDNN